MADLGIYTKFADISARAGANVSAVSNLVGWTDLIVLQVEAMINCLTRYNWSDAYAGLNADVKGLLTDTSAAICAIYVIQYDMSSIAAAGSLIEAEDRIVVLRDIALRGLSLLRDKEIQTFMLGA